MQPSAHLDTFARDSLPPREAFRFSGHLAVLNSMRMPIASMFFFHCSIAAREAWSGWVAYSRTSGLPSGASR